MRENDDELEVDRARKRRRRSVYDLRTTERPAKRLCRPRSRSAWEISKRKFTCWHRFLPLFAADGSHRREVDASFNNGYDNYGSSLARHSSSSMTKLLTSGDKDDESDPSLSQERPDGLDDEELG